MRPRGRAALKTRGGRGQTQKLHMLPRQVPEAALVGGTLPGARREAPTPHPRLETQGVVLPLRGARRESCLRDSAGGTGEEDEEQDSVHCRGVHEQAAQRGNGTVHTAQLAV